MIFKETEIKREYPNPEKYIFGMQLDNQVVKINEDEQVIKGLQLLEKYNGPVFYNYMGEGNEYGLVGLRKNHNRTLEYLRVEDKNGLTYTYDIKGAGYHQNLGVKDLEREDDHYYGLMDYSYALHDWEMWEKFSKYPGFLSFTPVAIIELKELPYYNELTGMTKIFSIEETNQKESFEYYRKWRGDCTCCLYEEVHF